MNEQLSNFISTEFRGGFTFTLQLGLIVQGQFDNFGGQNIAPYMTIKKYGRVVGSRELKEPGKTNGDAIQTSNLLT